MSDASDPFDRSVRIDGALSTFWEPLWQLRVTLFPAERALLASWPLRRLHFISHNGSSALLTGHTYSRLQHTLGVFALVTHFRPHDHALRAAALVHDIGHFPFSHTLEALPGMDHHEVTQDRLRSPELTAIFEHYDLETARILELLEGSTGSLLRNNKGILHLDHLDSWVRGAQARGQLITPPADLLRHMREVAGTLEMDCITAEEVVALILAEARFHVPAPNLGSTEVIKKLAAALIDAGELDVVQLREMTDSALAERLLTSPRTAVEARTLWFGPQRLHLTRETAGVVDGFAIQQEKLYTALPQVAGRPVDSPKVKALMAEAESLRGTYHIFWQV